MGVFYFLWQGQHGSTRIIDNSKLVAEHPDAINSEEEWIAAGGGVQQEFHFWGEPLLGYYSASDEWVFRKHVQMLTDAAVDFAQNPITDSSGRNDIVNMKVAEDAENYYFYVDTAAPLSSPDGGSWMTLFINENIVVNRTAPVNGKTDVEKNINGVFTEIGEAEIRYEGNKLMLKVSKALVDSADGFNFKWADNYIENDVSSFYTKGDAAPYGRLCYCY